MRRFKLVALPTFRLMSFVSSGSALADPLHELAGGKVGSKRTKDLEGVDIALDVA
jgi:hypothetical protein